MLAGIADGTIGASPACGEAVELPDGLSRSKPASLTLTLVLELKEVGDVAMHVFVDGTDGSLAGEGVLDADLAGIFVGDVGVEVGGGDIGVEAGEVALAIDFHVALVGDDDVERLLGVGEGWR